MGSVECRVQFLQVNIGIYISIYILLSIAFNLFTNRECEIPISAVMTHCIKIVQHYHRHTRYELTQCRGLTTYG